MDFDKIDIRKMELGSSIFFTKKGKAEGEATVGGKTYSFNIELPKNANKNKQACNEYVTNLLNNLKEDKALLESTAIHIDVKGSVSYLNKKKDAYSRDTNFKNNEKISSLGNLTLKNPLQDNISSATRQKKSQLNWNNLYNASVAAPGLNNQTSSITENKPPPLPSPLDEPPLPPPLDEPPLPPTLNENASTSTYKTLNLPQYDFDSPQNLSKDDNTASTEPDVYNPIPAPEENDTQGV